MAEIQQIGPSSIGGSARGGASTGDGPDRNGSAAVATTYSQRDGARVHPLDRVESELLGAIARNVAAATEAEGA